MDLIEKVRLVRKLFQDELHNSENDRFHKADIERIENDDWQVERFVIDCEGDVKKAAKNLIQTMAWRQVSKVNEYSLKDFPLEFFHLFQIEVWGQDCENRFILWESYKYQGANKQLDSLYRLFVAVIINTADQLAGRDGFTIVSNLDQAGIRNFDIGMGRCRADCLLKHFPQGVRKILVVNMPFYLKPVVSLIVSFMGTRIQKCLKHCTKEDLKEHIDVDVLPVCLEGTRLDRHYPAESVPFLQCHCKLGIKRMAVENFLNFYSQALETISNEKKQSTLNQ